MSLSLKVTVSVVRNNYDNEEEEKTLSSVESELGEQPMTPEMAFPACSVSDSGLVSPDQEVQRAAKHDLLRS